MLQISWCLDALFEHLPQSAKIKQKKQRKQRVAILFKTFFFAAIATDTLLAYTYQLHGRNQNIPSGQGWILTRLFYSHQCISQKAVRTSIGKQLDPGGISNFDFPVGGSGPLSLPRIRP